MLMGLGCIELVMFRGWLEVLSCTDQNTWDGSVVCVHMGFIHSACFSWCFLKNKRPLSPSSTGTPVGTPEELSRDDIVYFRCITFVLWALLRSGCPSDLPAWQLMLWEAWGVVPQMWLWGCSELLLCRNCSAAGRRRWWVPRYCSDIHLRCGQTAQWNLGSDLRSSGFLQVGHTLQRDLNNGWFKQSLP